MSKAATAAEEYVEIAKTNEIPKDK